MAAPFHNLQNKAEKAGKLVVADISASNLGNANVYIGLAGKMEIDLPCVIVTADQGEEDPPQSGLFWLTYSIRVMSDADVDADGSAHQTRFAYVCDAIWDAALAATLSGKVADFSCQGIRNRRILNARKEERHLVSEIQFDAACCPSDL